MQIDYTQIMLTILTIITGCLTIVTFFKNKSKDDKQAAEEISLIQADLKHIKELLIDVQKSTKEINVSVNDHSIEIARMQQDIKSAHKRIDEILERIEILERKEGLKA